jgi:hypothetical protein
MVVTQDQNNFQSHSKSGWFPSKLSWKRLKISRSPMLIVWKLGFVEHIYSKYVPPIKWGCWQNLHFWSTGGPLGNTYLMLFFSSLISFPSGWTVIVSQPVHLYKWPSLLVDSLHFFWKKRISFVSWQDFFFQTLTKQMFHTIIPLF